MRVFLDGKISLDGFLSHASDKRSGETPHRHRLDIDLGIDTGIDIKT